MSKPTLKPTNRGFLRGEFKDIYGQECSIQESSLADKRALWLGVDRGIDSRNILQHKHGEMVELQARMHIDREMAEWLWPVLKKFARKGVLEIK